LRKSFRRVLRSGKFTVTFDKEFLNVIKYCAMVPRNGQDHTWIVDEIQEAYIDLHEEGYAHSVEVYLDGKLVGGLYGLAMGKAFFGESMFSLVSDASKVDFKSLSDVLGMIGYDFIDCQMKTDHMMGLGAQLVERDIFLDELHEALQEADDLGDWRHFSWEYHDPIHLEGKTDGK
jgi:leucyl/phenylalanyl-tRNA--protein transferase